MLYDNPGWGGMGGGEGGRFKKEGTCVYLWLIHYGGMLETNTTL